MPGTGRGYVVLSGTIGGQYARGSIVPEGVFPEDRINHWVARQVVRKATEEDVEAAKGIQPSGSITDMGSRAENPSPTDVAVASAAARQAEIDGLELRLSHLKEVHNELSTKEKEQADEQTRAMEAAKTAEEERATAPAEAPTSAEGRSATRIGGRQS